MISLLQSFVAVLDEFGVSHGRAKKAALSAGEGLVIVSVMCSFPIFSC
jgi:nuclear cap-binding protein subunit 1